MMTLALRASLASIDFASKKCMLVGGNCTSVDGKAEVIALSRRVASTLQRQTAIPLCMTSTVRGHAKRRGDVLRFPRESCILSRDATRCIEMITQTLYKAEDLSVCAKLPRSSRSATAVNQSLLHPTHLF